MESLRNSIWEDIERLRELKPLVHNVTNYVAMATSANILLSIGASPIMAHAREELEELLQYAGALVINIGTLDTPWIASMRHAVTIANKRNLPVIIDPVGSGASKLRTETALEMVHLAHRGVLRGNASEVVSLVPDLVSHTKSHKGVDSVHKSTRVYEQAVPLLDKIDVIVISGEKDIVMSAKEGVYELSNGHPLMTSVTAIGCAFTSVIGAFAAVNERLAQAALHATALYGVAGEVAAEHAKGPGSFEMAFRDSLYTLSRKTLDDRLRCESLN